MAVAYQAVSTNDFTAESTTTMTKPSGTVDGDLLIAFIGNDDGASETISSVPSGWNSVHTTGPQNNSRLYSYYKIASSEGASWDWGWSAGVSRKAGIVLRIDGQSLLTPLVSTDDGSSGNDDTPTFAGGVTPTVADSLLVFATLSVQTGAGTGHSGWSIATSNPTWTERADFGGSADFFSVATATRPEITATGDFSVTIDGAVSGTSDSLGHIIAITPRVDASTSPAVITMTSAVQAPTVTGDATVSPSVITMTSSVQAPTATGGAPTWVNTDKSSQGSTTNLDKS